MGTVASGGTGSSSYRDVKRGALLLLSAGIGVGVIIVTSLILTPASYRACLLMPGFCQKKESPKQQRVFADLVPERGGEIFKLTRSR